MTKTESQMAEDEIANGGPSREIKPMEQVIRETETEALEALEDPYKFEHSIKRVAVIGAGPSGLAATRALLEKGFDVEVYERNIKVGGNWVYSEPAQDLIHVPSATEEGNEWLAKDKSTVTTSEETQLIDGANPARDIQRWLLNHHQPSTACYKDLFNNTATPVLGSYKFPWPQDTPYFVSHVTIQKYFEDYAAHFGLDKHIHLNTSLNKLEKKGSEWELTLTETTKNEDDDLVTVRTYQSVFDAVVIATGQFQDPCLPYKDGLDEYVSRFPGKVTHSKQFRRTDVYKNKRVLVVGGRVSAVDVARLVSVEADQVYMSYRGPFTTGIAILDLIRSVIPDNVIHKPGIEGFWAKDLETGKTTVDGTITFTDGTILKDIDHVIFATGYQTKHSYFGPMRTFVADDEYKTPSPEKESGLIVAMDKTRIRNTYKDIFLISDPTIAIQGSPAHITTTPFFEYQAETIARVWSREALLPSTAKMMKFSKQRSHVCPVYQMDHVSEQLRSQWLLPWLNLHANKLVPELRLPPLEGPSEALESVWLTAVSEWPEFVRRQQAAFKLERKGQE